MKWKACIWLIPAILAGVACDSPAQPAPPRAAQAVVRIPSHGASATVIETRKGYTLLLGCAHAFEGDARQRPMVIDVPARKASPENRVKIRLKAVDYQRDLSLIVLEEGPLPVVAPVAPAGHRPSASIWSVGYDNMRWPAQVRSVHIVAVSTSTTFTRERPWHGRSGGALLDGKTGWLIGVVQGYETAGPRRGMYVSHASILQFLKRDRQGRQAAPRYQTSPLQLCPT